MIAWLVAAGLVAIGGLDNSGNKKADIVIDSSMTESQAFDGLAKDCPDAIRKQQKLVEVEYLGIDGKMHRGQIVIHEALVDDIQEIFAVARTEKFPIESVIPVSHASYRKDGRWDDEKSMEANNTSCFNYRPVTGGKKLSNHALGVAVDLNPRINPYVKGKLVLPKNGDYNPKTPGTLTREHPVTQAFLKRGWAWGGDWTYLKDYQHFEKPGVAKVPEIYTPTKK